MDGFGSASLVVGGGAWVGMGVGGFGERWTGAVTAEQYCTKDI